MGVVHLARRGDGHAGRAQGAAPPHRGRRRGAAAAGPRGQLALPDPQPVGRRDRRRRPVGRDPLRRHPLRAGPLAPRARRRRRARSPATTSAGSPTAWPRASRSVHAVGVLHRDVKPSNVLMEGRTPILIDFGLARVADDPKLTHTGWLLGTPGYLAPEILYGDDATTASDVHSWAATVAFAGTGRPPFGRGPSMAIMDRVRRGEHDLSGLPDDLRRVVDAALDPDPRRRPTLDQLRDWLVGGPMPVVADPGPTRRRRRRSLHGARSPWPPPVARAHDQLLRRRRRRGRCRAPPGCLDEDLPRRGPPVAERSRRGAAARCARARRRRPPWRRTPGWPWPWSSLADLAVPRRLARGQRGRSPAHRPRRAVVRRPAAAAGLAVARRAGDPRRGAAPAVEPRPRPRRAA